MAHPDAAVFPAPVEAHQGLRPFPDEAEILIAARWSDADHGVVRPVCRHNSGAIPEVRRGLKAAAAERSAVRAQHLADAVRDRLASDVHQGNHEKRLEAPVFAAAELYTRAVDRSAV